MTLDELEPMSDEELTTLAEEVETGIIDTAVAERLVGQLESYRDELIAKGGIDYTAACTLQQVVGKGVGLESHFDRYPVSSYTKIPSRVNYAPTMEGLLGSVVRGIWTVIKAVVKTIINMGKWIWGKLTSRMANYEKAAKADDKLQKRTVAIDALMSAFTKETSVYRNTLSEARDEAMANIEAAFKDKLTQVQLCIANSADLVSSSIGSANHSLSTLFQSIQSDTEALDKAYGEGKPYTSTLGATQSRGFLSVTTTFANLLHASDVGRSKVDETNIAEVTEKLVDVANTPSVEYYESFGEAIAGRERFSYVLDALRNGSTLADRLISVDKVFQKLEHALTGADSDIPEEAVKSYRDALSTAVKFFQGTQSMMKLYDLIGYETLKMVKLRDEYYRVMSPVVTELARKAGNDPALKKVLEEWKKRYDFTA